MLRPVVTEHTPSFLHRVALAVQAFLRILANAQYAAEFQRVGIEPQLPGPKGAAEPAPEPTRDLRPALQLLGALQREGRLVDFLQQDIVTFSDADVGAAARVVHDGCRRALQRMVQIVPIHAACEGHGVTVPVGYDATSLLLSGNVSGSPPFSGTLRHRGWRANGLTLPEAVGDTDCAVIAPSEVEL
jgi:hypothetical protein